MQALTGLLGTCVVSFTNVVVWRLPRQESVVCLGSQNPNAAMPSAGMAISRCSVGGDAVATVMPRSAGVTPP